MQNKVGNGPLGTADRVPRIALRCVVRVEDVCASKCSVSCVVEGLDISLS
jgi:hypothetical protein